MLSTNRSPPQSYAIDKQYELYVATFDPVNVHKNRIARIIKKYGKYLLIAI